VTRAFTDTSSFLFFNKSRPFNPIFTNELPSFGINQTTATQAIIEKPKDWYKAGRGGGVEATKGHRISTAATGSDEQRRTLFTGRACAMCMCSDLDLDMVVGYAVVALRLAYASWKFLIVQGTASIRGCYELLGVSFPAPKAALLAFNSAPNLYPNT
jgi:hypothetical protein